MIGAFLVRLRWPLVALYILTIAGFLATLLWRAEWAAAGMIIFGLALQPLFCLARGDPTLLRPVTFHRSWLPAAIAGLLAAP